MLFDQSTYPAQKDSNYCPQSEDNHNLKIFLWKLSFEELQKTSVFCWTFVLGL